MDDILFSIVIPTYNRADFIYKTVQSILNQTYSNFEVIIVDDGSNDNTEEVVTSMIDNRIRYYKKENAERGAARNFGAKLARGEYINFFDSDDLAYPNHLENAHQTIIQHNNPEVFHLNFDIKDSDGNSLRKPNKIININNQLLLGNILSCNGVFIKRDIALDNPFNENRVLSASEDYLLWLTLASKYKILKNDTVTTTIIEHGNRSVLDTDIEKLIKRKDVFIKLLFSDELLKNYYNEHRRLLLSQVFSYIALHIALIKNNRWLSLKYLLKSVTYYPKSIFSKRFFATIKHLIIN